MKKRIFEIFSPELKSFIKEETKLDETFEIIDRRFNEKAIKLEKMSEKVAENDQTLEKLGEAIWDARKTSQKSLLFAVLFLGGLLIFLSTRLWMLEDSLPKHDEVVFRVKMLGKDLICLIPRESGSCAYIIKKNKGNEH